MPPLLWRQNPLLKLNCFLKVNMTQFSLSVACLYYSVVTFIIFSLFKLLVTFVLYSFMISFDLNLGQFGDSVIQHTMQSRHWHYYSTSLFVTIVFLILKKDCHQSDNLKLKKLPLRAWPGESLWTLRMRDPALSEIILITALADWYIFFTILEIRRLRFKEIKLP